ncbi:MAG TPA: hypothetical protein VG269_26980 [Tepidisphaeraceae bacterium]|nr:hypothetical protein [Tepidisphaeraceae bacterium]
MSLKRFVQRPLVRAHLRGFRPVGPHPLPLPMRVPPRSSNPQRLGTAFDYLFRFELHRRNRRAEHGVWVAELAAKSSGFRAADLNRFSDFDELYEHARRQLRESGRVLRDAKEDVAAYCRKRKPSEDDRARLASHALRLAAMDEIYRAGIFSADLTQVDEVAAKELVELLGIVPFENFVSDARTMLNPGFGKASRIVRGADADLIVGDLLIDVKTTKDGSVEADEIDQLLGYFILARQARSADKNFPQINRLGLYYSRHAHLWTWDVSALHDDRAFRAMEQWFIEASARTIPTTARSDLSAGHLTSSSKLRPERRARPTEAK